MTDISKGRIFVKIADGIGRIVIDNPLRRNAITQTMWRELSDALATVNDSNEAHVAVIQGGGNKDFTAGGDIAEADAAHNPGGAVASMDALIASLAAFDTLMQKPLIASIRGSCLGAGLAIAMKADIRIASRSAKFGIPAARLGGAYPRSTVEDLAREVGYSTAKMILMSADRYSADEALRMRLVNLVYDDSIFEPEVTAFAGRVAANAPLALKLAKTTVDNFARDSGNDEALDRDITACANSRDFAEGRKAFFEKRPPRFIGH